jgi:hypothetical protein
MFSGFLRTARRLVAVGSRLVHRNMLAVAFEQTEELIVIVLLP